MSINKMHSSVHAMREATLSMLAVVQGGSEHRAKRPQLLTTPTPRDCEKFGELRTRAREVIGLFFEFDCMSSDWTDEHGGDNAPQAHKLLAQAKRAKARLERDAARLAARYEYASTAGLQYARFASRVTLLPS